MSKKKPRSRSGAHPRIAPSTPSHAGAVSTILGLLGLGGSALMGTGHPHLAVLALSAAGLVAIWVGYQRFAHLKRARTLALLAGLLALLSTVLIENAIRDRTPVLGLELGRSLDMAPIDAGAIVDGVHWQSHFRRHVFTLRNDSTSSETDVETKLYLPDYVVKVTPIASHLVGDVVVSSPRNATTGVGEAVGDMEPGVTNTLVARVSGLRPGGSVVIAIVTAIASDDPGALTVRTVHESWGTRVTDGPLWYKVSLTDTKSRALTIDIGNPKSDGPAPILTFLGVVPQNAKPGWANFEAHVP